MTYLVTVLRYFTVYGPAGRPDMSLFRFVQWISEGRPVIVYGDGKQERDFTFREGVAQLVGWYQENREWARNVQTRCGVPATIQAGRSGEVSE